MITTFYPPFNFGGDGIFIQRLSHELARRGHQVDVIHCVDSYRMLAQGEMRETYEDHPGVVVHGLRSPFGWLSPLATQQTGYPLFKSRRIRKILEKGFDVINYHNISLVGGPGVLQYGRGIKLYTLHEYWLVCPTHVLFRFNRAPCVKKHCLLCGFSYKRPPQWWRYTQLLKRAVKHVDAFICPDRFSGAKHREMGLDLPIVHIPHFVPFEDSQPSEADSDETCMRRELFGDLLEGPYFLFVGRLEKLKGLQTVIPVFRRYPKARLLIAGTGTYGPYLRKLAASCENVCFLGYQTGPKLDLLYRNAVAVIAPSINYEVAPPLVIMEAFRQQTPAIVRRLGSMPEIIEESGGGLIYETEQELISALNRLLKDPTLRNLLGHRAHQALQERWTPQAYLEKYLGLIHKLMDPTHAGEIAR